jgi:hypothetical protein
MSDNQASAQSAAVVKLKDDLGFVTMPRKIRELIGDLKRAGFENQGG